MRESDGFERFIIADFYFPQWKLIVEIDGDVHTKKEVVYELDREKEILLQSLWYSILRFQNKAVLEKTDWVISQIAASFSL